MKNKYKVAAVLAVLFSVSAVATPVAVHAQYAGTSVIVQQTSQEFIFNYNPVSRVQGEIAIDETTFPDQNFRKWVTNNLSADGIKLTADEITNATDIDVSNQNISDLTGIEYFTELWWLNCSGNQLTTLDVSRNPDLYDLDCSNNQLTTLNINGAVVLENLNCSNNRLTTLNLSDNTALASLHCSGNQLTALDVRQKPLEVLDCSNNQLLSLNLMENDRLYLLRVNSNKLVCLNLRDAVYDEIALNNQLPNTITVENGIYDLTQLAAEINGDKITVTSGADQNGTILNNLTADTVVTYTYDCGSGQTLTVTLNVAQQEQLANSWTTPLSITGWTYGEPANAPTATAQYGQPSYTYSQNVNGPYGALPAQPNAGIWYVKATVAPGVDYLGLESDPVAFTIAKANSTLSITGTLDKTYDGTAVLNPSVTQTGSTGTVTYTYYKQNGSSWDVLTQAPADVGSYKVVVSLAADNNYNEASVEQTFIIAQTANSWTTPLSITGWTYGEPANAPTATAQYGQPSYTYSQNVNGPYGALPAQPNAGIWYVKATVAPGVDYLGLESDPVAFTIAKANSTLSITGTLDKTYDGTAVLNPSVTQTGSTGTVTYTYYKQNGSSWDVLTQAPADVGSYKVVVSLAADNNYNEASVEQTFIIAQTANSWTTPLSITGWTYGEPANAPTATAQYGQPSYTYSQNVNGPYGALPAQPNAGIWYVKATVAPGVDYLGLESDPVAFTIAKAVAPAVVFPSDLSAVAMNPLSSVELPQGWSWADATQILRVNQTDYIARYEVDGMNYDYAGIAGYNAQGNYIEVLLPVSVRKAVAPAIELPDNLTAVNGSVLSTVVLPAGWTWVVDTQQMVSPTNYSFSARLTVDDVNYDYTGVIGYNADGHYVESVLSLNIAAFENIWITPLSITGWAYGEPTNAPIAKAQYGNVMFTYSDAIDGVFTAIVPTQPGTWYVKATVAGTTDYNGLEAIAEFTIAPKVKKINNTSTGDVTNVGLWSSIFGTTGALFVGLLAFLKGKRSKDKVK